MSTRDEVAAIEAARELLEELGYTVRDRIQEAALFDALNVVGALTRAATDFLSDPNDFEYKKALRAALETTRSVVSRAE